ncbi:MAG: hypothetical protein ACHQ6T_05845 [Myxococcota bacterium]
MVARIPPLPELALEGDMSESDLEKTAVEHGEEKSRRPYERPEIVWREPYDPVSFGISCAKQPGNPSCATLVTA